MLVVHGGDACGCHNPLGDVVVVILSVLWLQVKTFDLRGLDGGDAVRRYPFGGAVVEPRTWSHFIVFGGKFWFFVFSFAYF
jgi:hypothetical protein